MKRNPTASEQSNPSVEFDSSAEVYSAANGTDFSKRLTVSAYVLLPKITSW